MPSIEYAAPSVKGRNLNDNSKFKKSLNGREEYITYPTWKLEALLQKKNDSVIVDILKEKYSHFSIEDLAHHANNSTIAKDILKVKIGLKSIRDIARNAKEYNNPVAVEVLREKYNTNELRLAVKTALIELSTIAGGISEKKETRELAQSKLDEIKAIEKRRKENVNLSSKSFTTVEELTRKPKKV